MTELFLSLIIISLFGYISVNEYYNRKERKDLLRLIKAKDLDEVSRAELVDKAQAEKEEPDPDILPAEDASPELFDKMIQEEVQQ